MTTSCYCWSSRSLHRRTNAGIVWVAAPGDYALFNSNHIPDGTTAASLIQSYENEAQRQRVLVRKADLAQTRLTFVVNALRRLFADEEFLTLLRAEAMHTLPRPLAKQLELSEG